MLHPDVMKTRWSTLTVAQKWHTAIEARVRKSQPASFAERVSLLVPFAPAADCEQ